MSRLYPPIIENTLPAFCLSFDANGQSTGAIITINYNLNKAVSSTEIKQIVLRLRTISTNTYLITENDATTGGIDKVHNNLTGEATFYITKPEAIEKLKIGQYYKVQLAFMDYNNQIGYFSTIGTIKCIAKPRAIIANYDAAGLNAFTIDIIGEYIQDTSTGDSSEKAYSYRFQIWDDREVLVEDSSTLLHNSSQDVSSFSSIDKFISHLNLRDGIVYTIQYTVTTLNRVVVSSPRYAMVKSDFIELEDDLTLLPTVNYEEGLVELQLCLRNVPITDTRRVTGNFMLLRSASSDNYSTWQEIQRFTLLNEIPSSRTLYDYTVEQGITYHYGLRQYNRQGFQSKLVEANERDADGKDILKDKSYVPVDVYADFEDMFLYDGTRQLKIRFNPQVSSFKNDLLEQKIETIGSKYPFIFRNGNVCYKEFPINGLISFNMDEARLFVNDNDVKAMGLSRFDNQYIQRGHESYETVTTTEEQELSQEDVNTLLASEMTTLDTDPTIHYYSTDDIDSDVRILLTTILDLQDAVMAGQTITMEKQTSTLVPTATDEILPPGSRINLTSDNIMSERYFKLLVLNWLTDGKPKLFRSATEGNYIVRILNVNLTPKKELGRMIHEFSCTAYEIGEFTYENLSSYNILTPDKITAATTTVPNAIDLNDAFNNPNAVYDEEGFLQLNLNHNQINSFSCINFAPGDQIKIEVEGETSPQIITIGASGNYIYENGKNIISFAIKINSNLGDGFSRDLNITTTGYASQYFDTISSIFSRTRIGEEYVGPFDNLCKTGVAIDLGTDENTTLIDNDPNTFFNHFNLSLMRDENNKLFGQKTKMTEILFLRAKKRIIVPIFKRLDNMNLQNDLYSLTPFGEGYVRYKTIAEQQIGGTIQAIDPSLDLTEAKEIKDLVQFSIDKCNLDKYCLFHIYVYHNDEWMPIEDVYYPFAVGEGGYYYSSDYQKYILVTATNLDNDTSTLPSTRVKPFYYRNSSVLDTLANKDGFTGYYDPYYEKWFKISEEDLSDLGRTAFDSQEEIETFLHTNLLDKFNVNQYDPSISIGYQNTNTGDLDIHDILLNEEEVFEEYNVEAPEYLRVGNGASLEMTYRLQIVDYTIENEKSELENVRTNLLEKIDAYNKLFTTYNNQEFLIQLYNYLINNLSHELYSIRNQSVYQNTLGALAEAAGTEQQNAIYKYWQQEYSINSKMLTEVWAALSELSLEIEEGTNNLSFMNNPNFQKLSTYTQQLQSYVDHFSLDTIAFLTLNNTTNNLGELTARSWPSIIPQLSEYTKDEVATIINAQKDTFQTIAQKHYYNNKTQNVWSSSQTQVATLTDMIKNYTSQKKLIEKALTTLGQEIYVNNLIQNYRREAVSQLSAGVKNKWATFYKNKLDSKWKAIVSDCFIKNIYKVSPNAATADWTINQLLTNNYDLNHQYWEQVINFDMTNPFKLITQKQPNGQSIYVLSPEGQCDSSAPIMTMIDMLNNNYSQISEDNRQDYDALYYNGGANDATLFNIEPIRFMEQYPKIFTITQDNDNINYTISDNCIENYFNLWKVMDSDKNDAQSLLGKIIIADDLDISEYVKNFTEAFQSATGYTLFYDEANPDSSSQIKELSEYIKDFKNNYYDTYKQIVDFYTYLSDPDVQVELQHDKATEDFIKSLILSKQTKLEALKDNAHLASLKTFFNLQYTKYIAAYNEKQAYDAEVQERDELMKIIQKCIILKNDLIESISVLRSQVQELNNNYFSNDNIQAVLTEQNDRYRIAINALTQAKATFIDRLNNLNIDMNNGVEQRYLTLLQNYYTAQVVTQNNDTDLEELIQEKQKLLDEYKTSKTRYENYIDSAATPEEAYEEVLAVYWKQYLTLLADIYKTEIKERFN